MKIFLVLKIFLLCVFNYSVIAETEDVKWSDNVRLYLEVDEFTKVKAYKIEINLYDSCELRIYPSKMIVNDEGDLIETPFMKLYFYPMRNNDGEVIRKGGFAESVKIMIDGKLQKVSGDGWEKKLISEMKKGKEIIVRGYVDSIDRTLTSRDKIFSPRTQTLLNKIPVESKYNFAKCWDEIPEEYIFFSDKDQKKEPEAKVVDDLKIAKRRRVTAGGDLDSIPKLLHMGSARYPSALLERGIRSGKVVLEVTISSQGYVRVDNVFSSTHPELIKMATLSAEAARFSIPKQDGKPVATIFRWPMTLQAPK